METKIIEKNEDYTILEQWVKIEINNEKPEVI